MSDRKAFVQISSIRQAFQSVPTPAHRTRTTLLADNLDAWSARWKLLESAHETINAQYYAWDHDLFGKAQLGHIYLRARQGTEVKVMVDAVGDTFGQRGFKSHRSGQDYLQELVALPNAEAKVYHPHYKKLANALLHPTGLQGLAANHDKILEVDGQAGTTGGRNTGYQYFTHPADDAAAWRDCDVLLEGHEAAMELRDAFHQEYDKVLINHPIHKDLLGNWRKRDIELLGAYSMMDQWLKAPVLDEAAKDKLRHSPEEKQAWADQLVTQTCQQLPHLGVERNPSKKDRAALQKMAMDLVGYPEMRGSYYDDQQPAFQAEVKIIDKTSAVGSGLDEMNPSLLSLIEAAEHKILLQTPYYVLTDPVIDSLQRAGQRGVEIRVATNSPSNTDSYFTQAFFLNDWEKSLQTIPNLTLMAATGERKHHAKMAAFDDQVAFVGTYNLDLVSAQVNGEVGALIDSPEFTQQVCQAMDKDLADPTVGYQQYKKGEFGPENHLSPDVLKSYDKRISRWNWARQHLPQLRPVRRFAGKEQ